jgi:hypothetical protein
MKREAIFASWVPPDSAWSLWARPILFAQMEDSDTEYPVDEWLDFDVRWAPPSTSKVVLVLDLPGREAVAAGLALAGRGYRPVPLYNACSGEHEVIDQSAIIHGLRAGAAYLAARTLTDPSPAFLLDARRMTGEARPKDFDNRWKVFPQDFPSAAFLIQQGFNRVLLVQRQRVQPLEDLAHVLLRWQDAGLVLEALALPDVLSDALRRWQDTASGREAPGPTQVTTPGPVTGPGLTSERTPPPRQERPSSPVPLNVDRPAWYRSAWQRVQAILGLRRSSLGGFGYVVHEPGRSHG